MEAGRCALIIEIKTKCMFRKNFRRRISNLEGLFSGHFVEVKAFYALEFNAICCVSFIGELELSKAFEFISNNMNAEILRTYQHAYYEYNDKKMFFNNTIFVLSNMRMIELGNNYCQVLHTPQQYRWAGELVEKLSAFRIVNRESRIGFIRQPAAN